MSNSSEKVEISGAICAPPPKTNQEPQTQQPRQPTNMQGLLKFALEATKAEDAPQHTAFQPLDENRKKFLQQALQSLTIDVIEVLLQKLDLLQSVATLRGDEDAAEQIRALEIIAEYVCDIDTANDFHKIGGFAVLKPCLRCRAPSVRAQACNLLAELSQNNPHCQLVVLENGLLPILVDIVENDDQHEVVTKAIYAISCNVRQNENGCGQLIQYRGIQVFLETLKRNVDKFNTKICFLLSALCASQPDFKSRLLFVGYIPILFEIIASEPQISHEHVLSLLLNLIEDHPIAINECRMEKYGGKEILEKYLDAVKNKEEFENGEETCNTILHILFGKK